MKINIKRTVEKLSKISTAQKRELQVKLAELIAEDSQKEIADLEAKLLALKAASPTAVKSAQPDQSDDL